MLVRYLNAADNKLILSMMLSTFVIINEVAHILLVGVMHSY